MNMAGYLSDGIKKFGEYEQFVYIANDRRTILTNTEIDRRARSLATGLQKAGIGKGDIVGVMVSNILEIPELMNGIMRMGAAYLPIIFMLTPKEIRYILEDSQARILITEKNMWPKMKQALEGNTFVKQIIVIGAGPGDDLPEKFIPYEAFVANDGSLGDVRDLSSDDLGILMYTSGSTGFPKGVMLTHGNLIGNMLQGFKVWPYEERKEVSYACVPMNHIYGCLGYHEACYFGGKLILVPPFDPVKTLEHMTEFKVSVTGLVPTMIILMMMVYKPGLHSLKSMKYCVSAGAPLAEETLLQAQEMFGIKILHGYGCTEAGPTIARQPREGKFKPGSVGPALPGLEMRLVDDEGREVPRGQVGEILVKGPGVTKGYWNKPKETAEALRDGWLHTGDLGRLDEDGELFIVGRKKDLIIKGGENIDPGVSENVLAKHPAVFMVATIGIPDAKYGEEVASAVILKPGQQVTEEDLLAYAKEHLHPFVAPKRIFLMPSFPMTGTGKVLKREIKEMVKTM
ncbi:MAG: AMP-binding protein [Syntrophaceae bacterium]|nr:AMP-binding protein [Syntrophaceae bacterium]